MRDKQALAADAIKVEQDVLREAVGAQDQVVAAYGGFNRINFLPDNSIDVRRVVAAPTRLSELEDTWPCTSLGSHERPPDERRSGSGLRLKKARSCES